MMKPPATIGDPLSAVDTPALLVDLDAFEANLKTMADAIADTGVRLRAHSKTHKSPIIGLKQMAMGAVGVCCQKVSEAEIMVEGGVPDVLVSNQIVGTAKLDRLAQLNHQARVAVCADHPNGVRQLSEAAGRARTSIDVLVEIDVGAGRCGVAPGAPAVEMAKSIAAADGLRFGGLQAYHGSAQHIRDHGERHGTAARAVDLTRTTVALLGDAGLDCEIIGGAGSGTFQTEAQSGVYNEIQAGSYVFMDVDYARNRDRDGGFMAQFKHALFVQATVLSEAAAGKLTLDAGHKACAIDSGPPQPFDMPGAEVMGLADEHCVIDVSQVNDRPAWGDKILLIPGHCDPTVNLHDHYVCMRGLHGPTPVVEDIWPVAARGALF